MDWMATKEAAEKWGITIRRVQGLCDSGKVDGVARIGQIWVIPKNTSKPIDGRTKSGKNAKRQQLHTDRLL
jgi:hypothetical protein